MPKPVLCDYAALPSPHPAVGGDSFVAPQILGSSESHCAAGHSSQTLTSSHFHRALHTFLHLALVLLMVLIVAREEKGGGSDVEVGGGLGRGRGGE